MKGFFTRFWGEIKAEFLLRARYPLEFIFMWIGLILIFVAIFFGINLIAGTPSSWGQEAAIRYALWVLCTEAIVLFPLKIEQEAEVGTLEQIFLSPKGGISLLIMRYIGGLLFTLVGTTIIFLVLVLMTQTPLSFSPGLFLIALLIVAGVSGVGFMLGALGLLFKRISPLANLMQMVFLGLALLPMDQFPKLLQGLMKALPLANGLPLFNDLMLGRTGFLAIFSKVDFFVLILNSVFYLTLGIIALRWAAYVAQRKGILGKY